jgi:hypothetical protein
MRLTDVCHLNERACTRTSCVLSFVRDFGRWMKPQESQAPCGMTEEPGASRHPRTLRRIARGTHCLCLLSNTSPKRRVVEERGRFLPTAPFCDRAL